MQKVVGSSPIIRSEKALETGPYLLVLVGFARCCQAALETIWKSLASTDYAADEA